MFLATNTFITLNKYLKQFFARIFLIFLFYYEYAFYSERPQISGFHVYRS